MSLLFATEPPVPQRFGPYEVIRELGRGGMGVVYEGIHEELGRRAAIKVMRSRVAHAVGTARFLREARLGAQIRHPNIVDVFDIGVEAGMPFIVMELLEGETLASFLRRRGSLAAGEIVDIFLPLLSAVAAAHEAGTVHRDLKPGNVILARRGRGHARAQPVVLDFGISKMVDDQVDVGSTVEVGLTGPESFLGTVHYMSPEQARGARFATTSSDQFSLGVMLYECATGELPFRSESAYGLMHAIVTSEPPRPSAINPSISPELESIILRAMDRDPARRFPSVDALGAALLLMGGATAWALWGREFGADRAGKEYVDVTLAEAAGDAISVDFPRGGAVLRARQGMRHLWALLAVASTMLFVGAVFLARRSTDMPSSANSDSSGERIATVTAASPEVVPSPAPFAPSRLDETARTAVPPSSAASIRSSAASRNPRATPAGRTGESQRPPPPRAGATNDVRPPEPETGSNNAPILP